MIEHDEQVERAREVRQLLADQWPLLEHAFDCARCAERVEEVLAAAALCEAEKPTPPRAPDPGPLLRKLEVHRPGLLQALDDKAAEARALCERLKTYPEEERPALVESPEFRSLPLANLLLVESWYAQPRDPEASGRLADLARRIADQEHPAAQLPVVRDVQARAWTLAANARRLAGDWPGADERFRRAQSYLRDQTGSSESAFFCYGRAHFYLDQGRLSEAAALFSYAAGIYDRCGAGDESGLCFAHNGFLCLLEGRIDLACEALSTACVLLDYRRDPGLGARARLALALGQVFLGRWESAERLIEGTRFLRGRVADAGDRIAMTWLEGRAAALSDQPARATELLAAARDGLLAAGSTGDAALAGLDLDLVAAGREEPERMFDLIHDLAGPLPRAVRAQGRLRVLLWFAAARSAHPSEGPSAVARLKYFRRHLEPILRARELDPSSGAMTAPDA